ncbi:MAG: SemiSWEET family sugar transporter [Thermoplasmata archaeon]|nr:SemiSWEET family sugar transporter [Thermoplasmata archaeon]RLF72737.1 MAG: hypothetical protein DRN55_05660 [Thermoplasmata archaeon]
MLPPSFIGYVAGTLTTVSFLPQVVKCLKTKSTSDISGAMYVIFETGVLLWLIYGLLTADLPIIVANSVTASLAAAVLLQKARYG